MDRPTNGHSRHEPGSITVVDLIRRQQGPVRVPSADEQATVQFMDDLLGTSSAESDHHRGWLSRSAKLAGLALGSLALCGSVYAASMFSHHRPPASGTTNGPATTVLTGVGALRPDTVAAQLSGRPTPGATQPAFTPAKATGHATGTIVGQAAQPTPTQQPTRRNDGPMSPADLVKTFYQLVATDPGLAAQLLAPSLLSTDTPGFDQAWSSMSRIEVESVQQRSANTVQAVVRMLEPDGTWLQVVELLHVTGGDTPLISGAELLSAQHG